VVISVRRLVDVFRKFLVVDWLEPSKFADAQAGWAVRRTWPGRGDHEFVCWRPTKAKAARAKAADAAFWFEGPIWPTLDLLPMSLGEFRYHARLKGCTRTDCTLAQQLACGVLAS
jgi:hypothetical protein